MLSRFLVYGPLSLLWPLSLLGQGAVQFANIAVGAGGARLVEAPVFDLGCQTRLVGPEFRAQLYAGKAGATEDELVGVGFAAPFSQFPGYFSDGGRIIPFVAPGSVATLQVRAFEASAGSFEAARATGARYGQSPLFSLQTGGRIGGTDLAPDLVGLESFCLIPEPSLFALALISIPIWGVFKANSRALK